MSQPRRFPRAGIDPIRTDGVALATVLAAVRVPLRHETVAVLLDGARRGVALVVVHGTTDADDVVEVAERVLDPRAHGPDVAGAVLASIRPGRGIELADADRWIELADVADQAAVELVEWYVIGDGIGRPRQLVDPRARW